LFAEIGGLPSEQGMSEITLARALARRGESEAARALAREAESRLESEADAEGALTPHARRVILAGSGRVELATGHPEAARRRLREALEIPALDLAADRHLIERIQRDLDSMPARETTALGTGSAPD
ncbi:MAG TPA: hypothetical protein VKA74_05235, partial [Myxococcota bacterium]|nr:hypothetical protein [Myxococcota bacterium]